MKNVTGIGRFLLLVLAMCIGFLPGCGGGDSAPPLKIVAQPTDQSVQSAIGNSARFYVEISGPESTFQWQRSTDGGNTWSDIAGATHLSYTLSSPTISQNGTKFRVIVSANGNSVLSSAATLTVTAAPKALTIATDPSDVTTTAGSSVSFSVTVSGTSPAYQWQVSTDAGTTWVDVSGATSSTLSLNSVTTSFSGRRYRVKAQNSLGVVTSRAAQLTVNAVPALPTISAQPQGVSVTAPQTATFSVTVTGTPTPTFQWQVSTNNGSTYSDIAGANGSIFTTPATVVADSGKVYRVRASNSAGTVQSNGATLLVQAAPVAVSILTQPSNQSVTSGTAATFTVSASGSPSPTYQWQISTNGGTSFSNITGATASSYTTAATAAADDGKYFRVQVTNSVNTISSDVASLTVRSALRTMYLDSGEILQVQLDNNGGATPKASAAFCSYPILLSTGQYARSPMVASTDGKYLFSIDGTGTKICSYTLSSTGAPFKTAVPFVSTNSTWSLEALPGRILAFDRFVNFLYNYAIDSAGKATQYLSQDISDPTAGGFPDFGTYRLAPGGKYLYALKTGSTRNSESGCYYTDVLSYAVEGDGRLSLKSGFQKPIKTDGNYCGDNFGEGLTINAAGTALYIPARDSGKIYQFSLSADGSIQPMATPSVETGGAAAAPYKLLSSPDGKFLYALDGDANLFWQYAVAANGQLSALTTPTAAACSPSYGKPIFADIDPVTGIIYLTCKSESELYAFRGGANGNLALLKTTPLGLIYPETFVFGR